MANQRNVLHSVQSVREEQDARLQERYGGFSWGADFIGFAVATFFTIVLLGIVGAVIGAVGYQMGVHVPKIGGPISGATQSLGIGALIGSLVAVFIAYIVGGYAAGRMARFDGVKNGIGVVIWTVVVAIVLGIVGAVLGNRFNVASQLHLSVSRTELTAAGIVSLAVTLVVMLLRAALGGWMGPHYHRRIDREMGVRR